MQSSLVSLLLRVLQDEIGGRNATRAVLVFCLFANRRQKKRAAIVPDTSVPQLEDDVIQTSWTQEHPTSVLHQSGERQAMHLSILQAKCEIRVKELAMVAAPPRSLTVPAILWRRWRYYHHLAVLAILPCCP
jgi:hypothetical protein